MLHALVNGLETTTISVADRAVLYGDSVFETIAVRNQSPLLLEEHLNRLSYSSAALGIKYQQTTLVDEINHLLLKHDASCALRVTISRGEGGRGYRPDKDMDGTRILSLHDIPQQLKAQRSDGISLGLSSIKLAHQPRLAGHKHSNRLEQVLASMELTDSIDELVMLDADDHVTCCSKSNIFVLIADQWVTPKLSFAGIAGVMRKKIISLMKEHKMPLIESDSLTIKKLEDAQAAFISNSLIGIVPVKNYMNTQLDSFQHCQPLIDLLEQSGCVL